jgi:L-fucose mutarotase
MTLKGIPSSLSPELLYSLARMGHGDTLVITDRNFPSDSVASETVNKVPIRVSGSTSKILEDILTLFPLDYAYSTNPVVLMDRVQSDKDRNFLVPAYEEIAKVVSEDYNGSAGTSKSGTSISFLVRPAFYEAAKKAFCIVQTDDTAAYANILIVKGVL